MPNKYINKPIIIEAIQFTGSLDSASEICNWCNSGIDRGEDAIASYLILDGSKYPHDLQIHTLEGVMNVDPNDFVIKWVEGEFYPCKPSIFEKTYSMCEENL